jgi:hypothetical protein
MVLRRILGPKREDVTGDWRKPHNEELHNVCASPNIIMVIKSRRMRWAGHVGRSEKMGTDCSILGGEPEGKRPLGRHRSRWKDDIGMDL